jgi:hypothetical protein
MIHYALRCAGGHAFDGWFKSSAGFDAQAAHGLVDCPVCGSTEVERALMAPSIAAGLAPPRGEAAPPAAQSASPAGTQSGTQSGAHSGPARMMAAPSAGPAQGAIPAQLHALLQRIRSEVEKSCDYVGPDFAQEVRRRAESPEPERPVYGEATPEEAAALAEDGIDVTSIPWVPRADS